MAESKQPCLEDPNRDEKAATSNLIRAHDTDIAARSPGNPLSAANLSTASPSSVKEYDELRKEILVHERALDFDYSCQQEATPRERLADAIIRGLRVQDDANIYGKAPPRMGYGGQRHPRFAGDHFLSNRELIGQTELLKVAQRMPKGSHLHIHFNACLQPDVLLGIAKGMDRMFIMSNMPLVPENFDRCEIQFQIMSPERERPGDLFSATYTPGQAMKFQEFRDQFGRYYHKATADDWLLSKLIFHEEEAHNPLQTASGAWEKFNGRTKMMKGLFNYETAYKKYTKRLLENFLEDNIIYAEIRPNFMMSNQLWKDDGSERIDNDGIMKLIIQEVESFQAKVKREGKFFGGLKVIYCTPRSFSPDQIREALDECLAFKKEWPQWIAGFDLVGEESKGRPIKDFVPELIAFQEKCADQNVEIPFLFHCGETLDMGTDTDGNLVDALLLKSKRIGHGFALPKHPYIMQLMKDQDICLELCPISNEILGLTPRVSGHAMYQLLANNVHCTISSDNGTLFRSTLSHDFYQVMVGKADMGMFGWKQLIRWSLQHACLDRAEYDRVYRQREQEWDEFVRWVIREYGNTSSRDDPSWVGGVRFARCPAFEERPDSAGKKTGSQ
ncbi:A-deaminase domain-containing protein [Fusarium sp. LHS14.1]|nr:A-deaminase domain-containing protein [Fusarium sp. LHS14.1]